MDFYTISIFLITYLICSLNPAIILCKKKTGEDIRKLGSGNAGTANAIRVLGKPLGILVVILDIAKVFTSFFIVTCIGNIFKQDTDIALKSVFMIAATFGHCFPIYYAFKGGKGVIVGMTTVFILDSKIAFVCLIAGIIVLLVTRVVSISTLSGTILYIIMAIVMMHEYLIPVLITSAIVMIKHRGNIHRILTKQESKLW